MSFWYIATPYTAHPDGIDAAFRAACSVTARLIKSGHKVFSPICHSHAAALGGNIDPTDHAIWLDQDQPFMDAAIGIMVVQMPGHEVSKGVAFELAEFRKKGKPVIFLQWPSLSIATQ